MASIRDVASPVVGVGRQPWDVAADAAVRREETNSVWLDSFDTTGSMTDDQMLTAAMTYAAAQTHPPVIKFGARPYSFTTGGRNVYSGFALAGPRDAGLQAAEQTGKAAGCVATYNGGSGTSSMFNATGGSIFNPMTVTNISWFSSNGASQWLHAPFSTANLYGATFGNLQFRGFLYCIGQPNNAATITLTTMWGAWNIPNMAGTPISVRGSDNWLVFDECNIGWNAGPTNVYLFRCENLSKTVIRGLYLTCRVGATRALLVDNQSGSGFTQGGLSVSDCVIEGQNLGEPAAGSLIYINQHGEIEMHTIALNFGMGNSAATTPASTGYIMAALGSGGLLNLHDITVTRATGVSQDVPIVTHSGTGKVYVSRIFGQPGDTAGQAWTDLPAVKQTGTGYMEIDQTVRVV